MHFVNKTSEGATLVLTVLINAGEENAAAAIGFGPAVYTVFIRHRIQQAAIDVEKVDRVAVAAEIGLRARP